MLPLESIISENGAHQAGYDNTRDLGWLNAMKRNPYKYASPEHKRYLNGIASFLEQNPNA